MNPAKNMYFRMIVSFVIMAAFNAHADIVNYTLENVILAGGAQITGTFDWTYSVDDFEGGSGEFTALEIPYTRYSFADGNLNIDIQTNSIEISGNGNYHDVGLDITLVLSPPFTPTQSASLDLDLSFFECCGNGFLDQPFRSGSIVPTAVPVLPGDFNSDGDYDCADVDSLVAEIVVGTHNPAFDLTGDSLVDGDDLDSWLAEAGTFNVGGPYLPGDADLNGVVDFLDFNIWAANRFTSNAAWCLGDFDASGVIDFLDFNIWAANRFQSSAVPEPSSISLLLLLCMICFRRKSG